MSEEGEIVMLQWMHMGKDFSALVERTAPSLHISAFLSLQLQHADAAQRCSVAEPRLFALINTKIW
jgi:hypothetical protein